MPHADPEARRAYHREYYQRTRERQAERARARKDEINARRRERYAADGERERERSRRYREENLEKVREADRRYARENSESRSQKAVDWQRANPERVAIRSAKRRARKNAGIVEEVVPLVVLELDDGVCGICHEDVDPTDFHVDHVVPLSAGGDHCYANVQVAHPDCNLRKSASLPW